jgi:periplasmic copper chaperone A
MRKTTDMTFKTILAASAIAALFATAALAEDKPMAGMEKSGMDMGAMTQSEPMPLPDAEFLADHGVKLGDLVLYNAFTRAMPPTARAGGGFVAIANTGTEDDRLVSAASPSAPVVQLHNMIMDNGVMIMREFENGIEIPAGMVTMLQPGGMHVMFIDAPKPFAEGETVKVTLTFEKAGDVTIDLPVGALGSTDMPMMH